MSTSGARRLDTAIEVLVALILVYLPLAFGGVGLHRRVPAFVMAAILLALTAIRIGRDWTKEEEARPAGFDIRHPYWPLAFFCAFLLVMGFQLSPLGGHPAPSKGFIALYTHLIAIAVFLAVTHAYPSKKSIRRLALVIILSGAFQALYGLFEQKSGRQHIFGYAKRAYTESATGTFINPNHFAAYLVMGLALILGAFLYRALHDKKRKGGFRSGGPEKLILLAFGAVLFLGAVLASGSRAAPVCLLAAVGLAGALLVKKKGRATYFLGVSAVAIASLIFCLWIGADPLSPRYQDLAREIKDPDARPMIYRTALSIWASAPILGTGAGTFPDAFRRFRPRELQAFYDHAHNDYLEILSETGLLGFATFYGGVFFCLAVTIREGKKRKSRFAKGYSLGATVGVLAMLFHGLVDFNLSIPANRATFFALLAIGHLTATRRLKR